MCDRFFLVHFPDDESGLRCIWTAMHLELAFSELRLKSNFPQNPTGKSTVLANFEIVFAGERFTVENLKASRLSCWHLLHPPHHPKWAVLKLNDSFNRPFIISWLEFNELWNSEFECEISLDDSTSTKPPHPWRLSAWSQLERWDIQILDLN